MGWLRHRKYSAAFKGIVVLVYVILFGSQLSHKFYLCANSPTKAYKHSQSRVEHSQRPGVGINALLVHKRVSSLSLDKRYETQHEIALADPVSYFPTYILPAKQELSSHQPIDTQSYFRINPLRGPPSV